MSTRTFVVAILYNQFDRILVKYTMAYECMITTVIPITHRQIASTAFVLLDEVWP